MNEFRDSLCALIDESDFLEAELNEMDEEGIAHVTLWSSKFEKSVNQVVTEKTVEKFPVPRLPEVRLRF